MFDDEPILAAPHAGKRITPQRLKKRFTPCGWVGLRRNRSRLAYHSVLCPAAMNAELKIAPELRHDPRPRSAVSGWTGAVGFAALLAYAGVARTWQFTGPNAALCAVVACGVPMVLWSVLVE